DLRLPAPAVAPLDQLAAVLADALAGEFVLGAAAIAALRLGFRGCLRDAFACCAVLGALAGWLLAAALLARLPLVRHQPRPLAISIILALTANASDNTACFSSPSGRRPARFSSWRARLSSDQ